MRRATLFVRLILPLVIVATVSPSPRAQLLVSSWQTKVDPILLARATLLTGSSRVVLRAPSAIDLTLALPLVQQLGGTIGRPLAIITAQAVTVPNASLATLAASSLVAHLSVDRLAAGALERTGPTIGATAARQEFGYDGTGVTVATIDSGITPWHDDLSDATGAAERVDAFVDFVNGVQTPYDDYGHGTHVGGIVIGNGFDSSGRRAGIAPGAHLVALKVLDASGQGRISDVIAALDYVSQHQTDLHIRIVNLSIAAPVYESYYADPLTLAARQLVNSGVIVVAAAGNNGRGADGHTQYGGVAAPGNAPWVLTVGASSHMGTIDRSDDTMAAFSSRGPSAVDANAKPDLVAPGVGIESLVDPNSAFYTTKSAYLLSGTIPTPYLPYLSLSGTSMATPVVSGTVALMLQANPALTPNAVKAILEYTAQIYPAYDRLTQGAGFLNAKGAVDVAYALARPGTTYTPTADWSSQIIWGTHVYSGGPLTAGAAEWSTSTTWGAAPWSEPGWSQGANVVWGSTCGGLDCGVAWSISGAGDSIAATSDDETVVWGTSDDDSTVVWGTSCSDPSCQPVIWQQ